MSDLSLWKPFIKMTDLFDKMEKLSSQLLDDNEFKLQDNQDEIFVTMKIPGMTKDNVDVFVKENSITVSGQVSSASEDGGSRMMQWSRFTRSYSLPARVNSQASTVDFKGDILEVRMPKSEKG